MCVVRELINPITRKDYIKRVTIGMLIVGTLLVITVVPIKASIQWSKLDVSTSTYLQFLVNDYLEFDEALDWLQNSIFDPLRSNNVLVIIITISISAMIVLFMVKMKRDKMVKVVDNGGS
jgi:hypothetical protein